MINMLLTCVLCFQMVFSASNCGHCSRLPPFKRFFEPLSRDEKTREIKRLKSNSTEDGLMEISGNLAGEGFSGSFSPVFQTGSLSELDTSYYENFKYDGLDSLQSTGTGIFSPYNQQPGFSVDFSFTSLDSPYAFPRPDSTAPCDLPIRASSSLDGFHWNGSRRSVSILEPILLATEEHEPGTTGEVQNNSNGSPIVAAEEPNKAIIDLITSIAETGGGGNILDSDLVIRVFTRTLQLCTNDEGGFEIERLPKCCGIAKTIGGTLKSDKTVVCIAFLELLFNELKAPGTTTEAAREAVLCLFRHLVRKNSTRNFRSVGYLLSSILAPHVSKEQVADTKLVIKKGYSVKEEGVERVLPKKGRINGKIRNLPKVTAKENGDFEAARHFFKVETGLRSKPGCVYPHVSNLFSSSNVKKAVFSKFAEGCKNNEALQRHFENLYEAFFNPSLPRELADMYVDIIKAGNLHFPHIGPLRYRRVKPHHFFTKERLWFFVTSVYNKIEATPDLFTKEPVYLPESAKRARSDDLLVLIRDYPTMDALMTSESGEPFLASARLCVERINPAMGDVHLASSYKIMNASCELLKINHCIFMILGLFYRPKNCFLAVEALEDTLKQMALYNIDPVEARDTVSALETYVKAVGVGMGSDIEESSGFSAFKERLDGCISDRARDIHEKSVAGDNIPKSNAVETPEGNVAAAPENNAVTPTTTPILLRILRKGFHEVCKALDVCDSYLVRSVLAKAENLRNEQEQLLPNYALPKCCGITKTLRNNLTSEGVKGFLAFTELLISDLKLVRNANIVSAEIIRFHRLFIDNRPSRELRSLGYLFASVFTVGSDPVHTNTVKEIIKGGYSPRAPQEIKRYNTKYRRLGGEIAMPEAGDFDAAHRFFTSQDDRSNKYAFFYRQVVNLFRSATVKKLIFERFSQGCGEDKAVQDHFENLYFAFFNPNLPLEVDELTFDVSGLGILSLDIALPGKVGIKAPHQFFIKDGQSRHVSALYDRIAAALDVLCGAPVPPTYPPKVRLMELITNVPTMDALMGYPYMAKMIDGAFNCANRYNTERSITEPSVPSYTILNATCEFLKINHAISMVLTLVYEPDNWSAVVTALEDTFKQMALHNVDPIKASKFVSALNNHIVSTEKAMSEGS